MLQVAEDPSGCKRGEYFSGERAFAFVRAMMDGKTRHDSVECSKSRERRFQIMCNDLNCGVGFEAFSNGLQHRRGEIKRDRGGVWALELEQCEQPSITCAYIQDTAHRARHGFQQDSFSLCAMGHTVGAS